MPPMPPFRDSRRFKRSGIFLFQLSGDLFLQLGYRFELILALKFNDVGKNIP